MYYEAVFKVYTSQKFVFSGGKPGKVGAHSRLLQLINAGRMHFFFKWSHER